MRDSLRRTLALTEFELGRIASAPATRVGVILFAALLVATEWVLPKTTGRSPEAGSAFGYAYLAAALITLRLGLAADREWAFDEYLTVNFVLPGQYLAAKVLALAGYLLAFGLYTFAVALVVAGGGVHVAGWHAVLFTLATWTFTPLILLVELVVDTRFPAVLGVLVLWVAVLLAELTYGIPALLDALGLVVQAYSFASLRPLGVRAGVAVPLVLLFLYPLWRLRLESGPPVFRFLGRGARGR